jgi:hypothetical protein
MRSSYPQQTTPAAPGFAPQRRRRTQLPTAARVDGVCARVEPTLLLVAPNSPRRQRVVARLTAHGYAVLTARTALGALAQSTVSDRAIDLLITAPLLPGLGGVPLTQRLRRTQPALPVVLTRLCEPPSLNGSPEGPAFRTDDDRMQSLLEEVRALLSL